MRDLPTTLAVCAVSIGLLAACTKTEVKREVVHLPCPMSAPARVCPTMPERPTGAFNPMTCVTYAIQLETWGECGYARDADWQQQMVDLHQPH